MSPPKNNNSCCEDCTPGQACGCCCFTTVFLIIMLIPAMVVVPLTFDKTYSHEGIIFRSTTEGIDSESYNRVISPFFIDGVEQSYDQKISLETSGKFDCNKTAIKVTEFGWIVIQHKGKFPSFLERENSIKLQYSNVITFEVFLQEKRRYVTFNEEHLKDFVENIPQVYKDNFYLYGRNFCLCFYFIFYGVIGCCICCACFCREPEPGDLTCADIKETLQRWWTKRNNRVLPITENENKNVQQKKKQDRINKIKALMKWLKPKSEPKQQQVVPFVDNTAQARYPTAPSVVVHQDSSRPPNSQVSDEGEAIRFGRSKYFKPQYSASYAERPLPSVPCRICGENATECQCSVVDLNGAA